MTAAVNGIGPRYLIDEGNSHSPSFHQALRKGVEEIVAHQLKTSVGGGSNNNHQHVGKVTAISDIRGTETLNYRKGEKVLRCKLAACYRLASIYRWDNGFVCSITARLGRDVDQFLINPNGILCDELTAAHLVKVDVGGSVIDGGCTARGTTRPELVALHAALYAARPEVNCAFFITTPLAVSLSILKCGLLPICHEAMVLGEISYADCFGSLGDANSCQELMNSFRNDSKVLFVRNFGVLVGGETVEETFQIANNLMTAVETQMCLVPFGLSNLHLPSNETLTVSGNTEHELPSGVNASNKWCYGEVEFEAQMRQLDNAGYSTGYVYRDLRQRVLRSLSTTDVPMSPSPFSDGRDSANLAHVLAQKRTAKLEWTASPNVYHRDDLPSGRDTPLDRKTPIRWVSDVSPVGLSKPRSSSVKVNSNRFAPQGGNPRELKEKVKEIRKEYFEDTITAGPQSTVLEGLTWEEARRIKAGHSVGGVDHVLVSAASRGVIQRDHQPKALFYKNFQMGNPFDNVSDRELEQYKREVEKKSKRGVEMSFSDSEILDRRFETPEPRVEYGRKSVDSEMYLREPKPQMQMPPVPSIRLPVTETNLDDVSPVPVVTVAKPVLTPKAQPRAPEPAPPKQQQQQPEQQLKVTSHVESDQDQLHRTQSARYPERAPDEKKEKKSLKSGSLRFSRKPASSHDVLLDAPSSREGTLDRSSKENTPSLEGGTLPKDKKKKRGFRLPSFSKKKEKQ